MSAIARLLVVIPAFNEGASLGALLDEFRGERAKLPCDVELVVIDDGSADDTAKIAAAKGARIVRLCRNLGIGAAVQTGLRLAYREGFDAAVQVDGDGQHPPLEIARLVERAARDPEADVVIGSRMLEAGGYRATGARRVGQIWLTFWLKLVCGLRITDPTSGFRLYGPRALRLFQENYPYDFPEPESLAVAAASGLRAAEQPVSMRARQGGSSSITGLRPAYYMIKVTFAVALSYLRERLRGSGGRNPAVESET